MGKNQDSGKKCLGLLAKFDPNTCSWKIPHCSLEGVSEQCLEIWPRWGSMRNGECCERPISEQVTKEKGYGLWPTPTSGPRDSCCKMETAIKWYGKSGQNSLSFEVAKAEKIEGRHMPHGNLNPEWVEWLMGWQIGWTDLRPLEMDRFQEWLQLHGKF